ncbi:cytochrome c oxidase subunit II [bacterium]|nr:cytochrome c oxidase subunit II [bacterium]
MDYMPQNIASYGGEIDQLTWLITAITFVCLVIAEGFLLVAAFRFRRGANRKARYITGEAWKQARYVLIPVLLIVALDFYIDIKNAHAWTEIKQTLPTSGMQVGITAEQFLWTFSYPGEDTRLGTSDDLTSDELHIPVGTNVTYQLQAKDVLHSLWIPAMRLKQDALPGRTEKGWMQATEMGTFDIACAEICGEGHSKMAARLVVQNRDEYQQWLHQLKAGGKERSPEELMRVKGCFGCHSLDGTPLVGPTYKGLFGRQETVITDKAERVIEVDEAYLRKSILEPNADVVKKFPPAMPDLSDKLSPEEVDQIVNFLKTVK